MNPFVAAAQTQGNVAKTHNGALTHKSSQDRNVDFFFVAGNRNKDFSREFEMAYQQDRELALRTMLWSRDIREGAGERQTYKNLLNYLEVAHPEELPPLVKATSQLGRWDDLIVLRTEYGRTLALEAFAEALRANDLLAGKWAPSENAGPKEKRRFSAQLREHMGLTPRAYRKMLSRLRSEGNVVEVKMCAKDFASINYSQVPSVASSRLQKAFGKNDPERYVAYLNELKKPVADRDPKVKINAGAVYPYDVIRSIRTGNATAAQAQWDALPNYLGDESILAMVDVSGSMQTPAGGVSGGPTCMDISLSLGMYVADKNTGPFKDCFLTFSGNPKLHVLQGNLTSKMAQVHKAGSDWGMNTNLEAAFSEILNHGLRHKVSEADMPKVLLILSDMEFDACTQYNTYNYLTRSYTKSPDDTLYDRARKQYSQAGYTLPRIVFWNLNSRAGNNPVKFNQQGTALVSGFSPSILKAILGADLDNYTPRNVMLKTIMVDRYNIWK